MGLFKYYVMQWGGGVSEISTDRVMRIRHSCRFYVDHLINLVLLYNCGQIVMDNVTHVILNEHILF